jgi:hypothetical protein
MLSRHLVGLKATSQKLFVGRGNCIHTRALLVAAGNTRDAPSRSQSSHQLVTSPRLSRNNNAVRMVSKRHLATNWLDLKYETVSDLIRVACKEYADMPSFGVRKPGVNAYEWITYKQLSVQIQRFRNVLVHHKIGKNDKVRRDM